MTEISCFSLAVNYVSICMLVELPYGICKPQHNADNSDCYVHFRIKQKD